VKWGGDDQASGAVAMKKKNQNYANGVNSNSQQPLAGGHQRNKS
jgi:hypothetical protein